MTQQTRAAFGTALNSAITLELNHQNSASNVRSIIQNLADSATFPADEITPTGASEAKTLADWLAFPLSYGPPATGRLTLTSGVPVTTSDVTAGTSVFFTPFEGEIVRPWDGVDFTAAQFAEMSVVLDGNSGHTGYHQSGKNFDVFVFLSGDTLRLGTGPVWSSDTARGTGAGTTELELKNGIWTNKVSMTARYGSSSGSTATVAPNFGLYVGSFRTTADGQTEDSYAKRFVWNNYNRKRRPMKVLEATDSWAYSTATTRQARASSANQIDFLLGLNEDAVKARLLAACSNDTTTARNVRAGLRLDATSGTPDGLYSLVAVINVITTLGASFDDLAGLGRHFIAWVERGNGSDTQTWYGDNSGAQQCGIVGEMFG